MEIKEVENGGTSIVRAQKEGHEVKELEGETREGVGDLGMDKALAGSRKEKAIVEDTTVSIIEDNVAWNEAGVYTIAENAHLNERHTAWDRQLE